MKRFLITLFAVLIGGYVGGSLLQQNPMLGLGIGVFGLFCCVLLAIYEDYVFEQLGKGLDHIVWTLVTLVLIVFVVLGLVSLDSATSSSYALNEQARSLSLDVKHASSFDELMQTTAALIAFVEENDLLGSHFQDYYEHEQNLNSWLSIELSHQQLVDMVDPETFVPSDFVNYGFRVGTDLRLNLEDDQFEADMARYQQILDKPDDDLVSQLLEFEAEYSWENPKVTPLVMILDDVSPAQLADVILGMKLESIRPVYVKFAVNQDVTSETYEPTVYLSLYAVAALITLGAMSLFFYFRDKSKR